MEPMSLIRPMRPISQFEKYCSDSDSAAALRPSSTQKLIAHPEIIWASVFFIFDYCVFLPLKTNYDITKWHLKDRSRST